MKFESNKDHLDINDVLNEIHMIKNEISVMGANDSEFYDFDIIESQLKDGKISSRQALERARSLRDRKQNYH